MSVPDVLPPSPPTTLSRPRPAALFPARPPTSTPDDSPASFPGSSSLGSRKRVEFATWMNIHPPATFSTSSIQSSAVKPLPPSRECQSSSKSILKIKEEDDGRCFGLDGQIDTHQSLDDVMESVVQQLARNDRTESIDAYQTLASTMKAYDDVPDEAILKSKINSILKYIRRDLTVPSQSESASTDTTLVTQALKLLVILVWSPVFSPLLADEFRIFLLDKAVQVITEHAAPKSVIIHFLHLLATQNFRAGLVNSNSRLSKLLEALNTLTDHVKGNAAVSERLLVYQKFLDQARSAMKAKAHCWVGEMLSGMASSIADTRSRAIALGRKTCQVFPASSVISQCVRAALERELENGKSLGLLLCRKMEKMVAAKEDALQVPQMWAVVILLCNDQDSRIDSWTGIKDWLKVIQRCFNSSDSGIRQEANMAWNRFVYVVRPHQGTDSLVSMLAKPIVAQVERCGSDKAGKNSQMAAVSSYCNLLYYSFRPAATHKQYTRLWNEYIVKVMKTSFFEKNPANADIASRILMALFWNSSSATKIWNENRAHENSPVQPHELPTIDCKWTRQNCSAILQIFQIIFKYSSWGPSRPSAQAYISQAWRHFLKAIRDAGAKEVKLSTEAKTAIQSIISFIANLKSRKGATCELGSTGETSYSFDILDGITQAAVTELGVSPFLEILEASKEDCPLPILISIFDVMSLRGLVAANPLDFKPAQLAPLTKLLRLLNDKLCLVYEASDSTSDTSAVTAIVHVLSGVHDRLVEPVILDIALGLATWLRDEDSMLCSSRFTTSDLEEHSADTAVQGLSNVVKFSLSKVRPETIEALDDVFAAAFKSRHRLIVNAAVQMWNDVFGKEHELTCGPCLSETLLRLQPFVELELPSHLTSEIRQDDFVEQITQFEDSISPETTARSNFMDPLHPPPTCGPRAPAPAPDDHEHDGDIVDMAKEAIAVSKLRHDDSQVQFLTIHSSPHNEDELESQNLTARQKEVRERQRIEPVVVFPDLRSSPRPQSRPQSRHSESVDCEFARKAASMSERPSTPILLDHVDIENPEPAPSPTPKARHMARRIEDVEIPSSPPSVLDNFERIDVGQEAISSPLQEADERQDVDVDLALNASVDEMAEDLPDGIAEEILLASQTDMVIGMPNAAETNSFPLIEHDSVYRLAESAQRERQSLQSPEEEIQQSIEVERVVLPVEPENGDLIVTPLRKERPQIITSPLPGNTPSDEIDELSASQLSGDLDWHVTLEMRASTGSGLPDESHQEASIQIQDSGQIPDPISGPYKRKRTANSGSVDARMKRRRLSSSSLSQNNKTTDSHPSLVTEHGHQEATAHGGSLITIAGQQHSTNSQNTCDEPILEQQPTVQHNSAVCEPTTDAPTWLEDTERSLPAADTPTQNLVEKVEANMRTEINDHRQVQHRPTPEFHTPMAARMYDAPVSMCAKAAVDTTSIESVNTRPPQSISELFAQGPVQDGDVVPHPLLDQTEPLAQPAIDVVASLQAVLKQLKTTAAVLPDTVDLRAVDELCFQIRFHAQAVAMRNP